MGRANCLLVSCVAAVLALSVSAALEVCSSADDSSGACKIAVPTLGVLFGSQWNSFLNSDFEQRFAHVRDGERNFGFGLKEFALILENSLTIDMMDEFVRHPKDVGSVEQLSMMRGNLRFQKDLEISAAGGGPSLKLRKKVAESIDKKRQGGSSDGRLSGADWLDIASSHGLTMIVRDADCRHPQLFELADRIRTSFGLETGTSLYFTPPSVRGVEPHIDEMDVIMLQVHGSKTWQLEESEDLLPDGGVTQLKPSHYRRDKLHDGPKTVELREGEVLYVPRGYIHNATSGSAGSLHISIGLEPLPHKTIEQLLQFAIRHDALNFAKRPFVEGVDGLCFSERSPVEMFIKVTARHFNLLRQSVPRPADTVGVPCTRVDESRTLQQWISHVRGQAQSHLSTVMSDLEPMGNVHRESELVQAFMGEEVLATNMDAWFDNDNCDARGAAVAAKLGSYIAKKPHEAFERVREGVSKLQKRLREMSDEAWCDVITDFHDHATQLEEENRKGMVLWARANERLLEGRELMKPLREFEKVSPGGDL